MLVSAWAVFREFAAPLGPVPVSLRCGRSSASVRFTGRGPGPPRLSPERLRAGGICDRRGCETKWPPSGDVKLAEAAPPHPCCLIRTCDEREGRGDDTRATVARKSASSSMGVRRKVSGETRNIQRARRLGGHAIRRLRCTGNVIDERLETFSQVGSRSHLDQKVARARTVCAAWPTYR